MDLAVSRNGGWIASGARENVARIWNALNGQSIATLTGHTGWVTGVAFRADNTMFATASYDGTIRLWDPTNNWQFLRNITGLGGGLRSVAFSADGLSILYNTGNGLAIRSVATGALTHTLPPPTGISGQPWMASFSPNEQYALACLGTGAGSVAVIWDLFTRQAVQTLTGHTDDIRDCRWSPSGQQIITPSLDQTARIWGCVVNP
jgi:WD40 repeat protein